MQALEKTKEEIQNRAEKMSDFLKMEYLESCSKKTRDVGILRYCYIELSKLYEKKLMYSEAVKYLNKFQEVCINQKENMQICIKEIELLIRGGFYDRVNFSYQKAIENATEVEKFEIKRKIIELYKKEAIKLEKLKRNSGALKIYERLVYFLPNQEKTEIKKKIFVLYLKLGKVRESMELEKELRKTIPSLSQPYKTISRSLSNHL